jgi:hypothetical protein
LQQIDELYVRLEKGLDVAPAARYRLEGQAELLLTMGAVKRVFLQDYCATAYMRRCKKSVSPVFWRWAEKQGRFILPFAMQEAPVYPTKK